MVYMYRYSLYSLKTFIFNFLNDYQYVFFLHNTNLNPLAENFTQEEIGEPILDTELVAGDVLYFPRGTIHQVSNFLSWGAPKSTNSWTCILSTFRTGSFCNLLPGAIIFSCIFKIFFFVWWVKSLSHDQAGQLLWRRQCGWVVKVLSL